MKLWAVEEWLFSSTRSQACVLQQSEDIADTVEVSLACCYWRGDMLCARSMSFG